MIIFLFRNAAMHQIFRQVKVWDIASLGDDTFIGVLEEHDFDGHLEVHLF